MTKVTYEKNFFNEMTETNLSSAREVAPHIIEMVSPKSVIDIGCGEGLWLKAFSEAGVSEVRGLDGEWVEVNRLQIKHEDFTIADLKKPIAHSRTYDLAVSLEVAEHLPDSAANIFVSTLTSAAPVILFSAAIPLQGGTHHVNEQWPAYWVEKFAAHGYIPVDCVRRKIWDNKKVSFFYAQNIFIYVKKDLIEKYPKLQAEIEAGNSTALPLVHPYMYLYYAERWRTLVPFLGKFPPGFLHTIKKILMRIR